MATEAGVQKMEGPKLVLVPQVCCCVNSIPTYDISALLKTSRQWGAVLVESANSGILCMNPALIKKPVKVSVMLTEGDILALRGQSSWFNFWWPGTNAGRLDGFMDDESVSLMLSRNRSGRNECKSQNDTATTAIESVVAARAPDAKWGVWYSLVAVGWSKGRVLIKGDVSSRTEEITPPVLAEETRIAPNPDSEIRDSVGIKVVDHKHEDDAVKHTLSHYVVTPDFVGITASLRDCIENEQSCLKRHLKKMPYAKPELLQEQIMDIAADAISDALVTHIQGNVDMCVDFCFPNSWATVIKERMSELCEAPYEVPFRLGGFVKPKELGLPLTKLARGIGNPGVLTCARAAPAISLIEHSFLDLFSKAMTKGKTNEELDNLFEVWMSRFGPDNCLLSFDFGAMDSSSTPNDKGRFKKLVRRMCETIRRPEYADRYETGDPAYKKYITWYFRHITVSMNGSDSILFSGERCTSIYNRFNVLVLFISFYLEVAMEGQKEMTNLLRKRLQRGAKKLVAKLHTPGTMAWNVGDGDDVLVAFPPKFIDKVCPGVLFSNAVDRHKAMAQKFLDWGYKYHKTLELCQVCIPNSNDFYSCEVLSRYHAVRKGTTIHFSKLQRNLQRCAGMKPVETTPGDVRHMDYRNASLDDWRVHITSVLDKAYNQRSVPGYRWVLLGVAKFCIAEMEKKLSWFSGEQKCQYAFREERFMHDERSIAQKFKEVQDSFSEITEDEIKLFVDLHFPLALTRPCLSEEERTRMVDELERFDVSMRDFEYSDLHTISLAERACISREVCRVLGFTDNPLEVPNASDVLPPGLSAPLTPADAKSPELPQEGQGGSERDAGEEGAPVPGEVGPAPSMSSNPRRTKKRTRRARPGEE